MLLPTLLGSGGVGPPQRDGAVGNVVILASRLSDAAAPAEILLSQRLNAAVEGAVATEPLPEQSLKGFSKPVQAFRVA